MEQPQLELIPGRGSQALVYKVDRDIWPVYHYHPEFDILLSLKDHAGQYLSGDAIGDLIDGTLIMNGPNVPHCLLSGRPDERDSERPSLAVIQFSRDTLGEDFLGRDELREVSLFLDEARCGFEFFGNAAIVAREMILQMEDHTPLQRVIDLLSLLSHFANSEERRRLASPAFSPSLRQHDISRLDRVLRYLQQRRFEEVTLESVSRIANLSPKSFCRFFKSNTGKTLTQYLAELRIGEACRKLIETDESVSEIAIDCGFQNLSNFNRRFLALKGVSPREFRRVSPIKSDRQNLPTPSAQGYRAPGG
ncbi:MAG: AraC family transcriptional regulator [Verrucomicrobiota bacterium]